MKRALLLVLCWLLLSPEVWAQASRSFDGTNDEVEMGDVLDAGAINLSVCIWIKATEDASVDAFWGKKNASTAGSIGWMLIQQTDDALDFITEDNVGTIVTADGTTDIDGVWYFACGIRDVISGDTLLFLNAIQEDATNGLIFTLASASELSSGENGGEGEDAAGLTCYASVLGGTVLTVVDMLEIMWNPEIAAIYVGGANIIGFWTFWGDSTEIDLSLNANNGTVSNASTSTDGPPVMFGMGLPI